MEISGYPDSSALKISTWGTDSRPEDPVEGVFGFNTDTGQFEYFDGSDWQNLTITLPEVYDKARCDQNGNVIDETYATKTEVDTLQTQLNSVEGNLTILKIWDDEEEEEESEPQTSLT